MVDRKSKYPNSVDAGETLAVDCGLADRAAEGDRSAFEEIYRRYVNRVYGLCPRLTTDVAEAETLTQDTFVKAWLAIVSYAGRFRAAARRGRLMEEMTETQCPYRL